MLDGLNTNDARSSAETVVTRVYLLTDRAVTTTRYMRALEAGADATAASEPGELSKLCEQRASWAPTLR